MSDVNAYDVGMRPDSSIGLTERQLQKAMEYIYRNASRLGHLHSYAPQGSMLLSASAISGSVDISTGTGVSKLALFADDAVSFGIDGWGAASDRVLMVDIEQDGTGGRAVTITGIDAWVEGYSVFVNPTPGSHTVLWVMSDDGGATQVAAHGQRLRKIVWPTYPPATDIITGAVGTSEDMDVPGIVRKYRGRIKDGAVVPDAPGITIDFYKNTATILDPLNRAVIAAGTRLSPMVTTFLAAAAEYAADDEIYPVYAGVGSPTTGQDVAVSAWVQEP